jgi:hypothetical protein
VFLLPKKFFQAFVPADAVIVRGYFCSLDICLQSGLRYMLRFSLTGAQSMYPLFIGSSCDPKV